MEQALVHIGAHNLARGADPLGEDPKPAQGSATQVHGTSAGSVAEPREQLPPTGLPHTRLQLQAFQLRGLVGKQIPLMRHLGSISLAAQRGNTVAAEEVGTRCPKPESVLQGDRDTSKAEHSFGLRATESRGGAAGLAYAIGRFGRRILRLAG
jgi:hypothetical protein